jgi:hypothetical protein
MRWFPLYKFLSKPANLELLKIRNGLWLEKDFRGRTFLDFSPQVSFFPKDFTPEVIDESMGDSMEEAVIKYTEIVRENSQYFDISIPGQPKDVRVSSHTYYHNYVLITVETFVYREISRYVIDCGKNDSKTVQVDKLELDQFKFPGIKDNTLFLIYHVCDLHSAIPLLKDTSSIHISSHETTTTKSYTAISSELKELDRKATRIGHYDSHEYPVHELTCSIDDKHQVHFEFSDAFDTKSKLKSVSTKLDHGILMKTPRTQSIRTNINIHHMKSGEICNKLLADSNIAERVSSVFTYRLRSLEIFVA